MIKEIRFEGREGGWLEDVWIVDDKYFIYADGTIYNMGWDADIPQEIFKLRDILIESK